jgi:outer membrane protein
MRFKFLTITFASVLFSLLGFSQQPWSLSDCIDYAHANNLQIKRTELQADIAKVNELQAKTNILPDLNADINRSYSFGHSLDPFTNSFITNNSVSDNYQLSSSVALFNGLQNFNNIKRTEYATLAAMTDIEQEKIDITMQISTAYLDILFKKELLEITKSQKELTAQQLERTSKLVDAGSLAKGELLEIQSQLANESLNVTNAKNDLNLSYLNLVQILALDSLANFDIVVPDTVEPDFIADIPIFTEIYNEGLLYLPHIKSAQYSLKSNEHLLAMRKGERSPTIYLSGSVYTGYSDQRKLTNPDAAPSEVAIGYLEGDPGQQVVTQSYPRENYPYQDQFHDNVAERVTVGVRIPILNHWETNNNIRKARIQLEDSQYNLEQFKQQLMKEVRQAHNDAISAREKYYAAIEAVNSYKESFHYTEQKFNVGIVNSVDYNISKNNLIKAESDLLQAKYSYIFSVKILDFYRGIPITL